MIVVEGMDGTGKSILVKRLSQDLQIPVHRRAATSIEGPRADLYEWVRDDVATLDYQPFSVYDRHPLVSDFVYGPIVRRSMDARFHTDDGKTLSDLFAGAVMVVFCDPGIAEVEKNTVTAQVTANLEGTAAHMPGVVENWESLYWSYKALMHYWPGQVSVWDYRYPQLYSALRSVCVEFMSIRKTEAQR